VFIEGDLARRAGEGGQGEDGGPSRYAYQWACRGVWGGFRLRYGVGPERGREEVEGDGGW